MINDTVKNKNTIIRIISNGKKRIVLFCKAYKKKKRTFLINSKTGHDNWRKDFPYILKLA